MAVAFALLDEVVDTTVNSNDTVTPSVVGTAGQTIFIVVMHGKGAGIIAPSSITGASISGAAPSALKAFDTVAAAQKRIDVWKATATGAAGASTVLFSDTRVQCFVKVVAATGDSGTVVNTATGGAEAQSSGGVTMPAYADADNGVLFAIGHDSDGATIAGEAGWTPLGALLTDTSPTARLHLFWRLAVDVSPSATFGGVNRDWGAVGIELDAGAGGTPPPTGGSGHGNSTVV
jgi:hypothetical protein